jgi:hypothetical protein
VVTQPFYSESAAFAEPTRQQFFKALRSEIDPDRQLIHLSHVCNLRISGRSFPVIDLQEIVKGAATPRGVNTIIILAASLHPIRKIGYTRERPLFCKENQLYVWGDLTIDGIASEGNTLTFTNSGKDLELSHVEANNYPVPLNRNLKDKLQ